MEEDYLDDNEELDDSVYYQTPDDDDESDGNEYETSDEDEGSEEESPSDLKKKYGNKLTETEVKFITAYDDLVRIASSESGNEMLTDAVTVMVDANPKHTNAKTVGDVVKELLGKQGHNRMVNSVYSPTMLTSEDVETDYLGGEDFRFNKQFTEEARQLIARFIEYLANRDLSKDDELQRRRKRRNIPAFLIFLFSAGLYDLVLNCPTLPEEYAEQVKDAFKKIMKSKYDIVEELARKYEEVGRPLVAERVRRLQLAWFEKEPADIRTSSEYSDLDITYDDVVIYRSYRSRFTNTSKAITQDVISNSILVSLGDGQFEKLKDKTRFDAITDVKVLWRDWVKDNAEDSELAKKIIWKDSDLKS